MEDKRLRKKLKMDRDQEEILLEDIRDEIEKVVYLGE